ncbi:MAG: DUF167 domain-containing protein [Patescibacteria group bacterium]
MKINLSGNNLLKVKVYPNSSEEKIIKKKDRLIIKVKEEAREGRANKRVFEILSLIFPQKGIELIKGSKSQNKIFKIHEHEQKN